jgi:hypothetical protein
MNWDAVKCKRDKSRDQAQDFANAHNPNPGNLGEASRDEWNAVLHTYGAVLVYFNFGAEHGKDILWAHELVPKTGEEAGPVFGPIERQMDFANNTYGLAIAAAVDELDISRDQKVELSGQLVVQAVEAGLLCYVAGEEFANPGRCGG